MNRKHLLPFFGVTLLLAACSEALPRTPAITKSAQPPSSPVPTQEPLPTPNTVESLYPTPLQILTSENISDLEHIDTLGEGIIGGVAISPDKQTFAVHTGIGVYLYDSSSFEQKGFIKVRALSTLRNVHSTRMPVAFSPNGKLLAYSMGNVVQIWDLDQKTNLPFGSQINEIPASQPINIVFSHSSEQLLITTRGYFGGCESGQEENYALYDLQGNLLFDRYSCNTQTEDYFRFTNDGKLHLFFTLHQEYGTPMELYIVEASTGSLLESYAFDFFNIRELISDPEILEDEITYYDVSPDGTILAYFATREGELVTNLVHSETGELLQTINGAIEFGDSEKNAIQWRERLAEYNPQMFTRDVCGLAGHKASGYFYEIHSTDSLGILAFTSHASSFGSIELWDFSTCEVIRELTLPSATEVLFSADGRWLLGSNRTDIYMWDLMSGGINQDLRDQLSGKPISKYTFTDNGTYLIAAILEIDIEYSALSNHPYHIEIWDTSTGSLIREIIPIGIDLSEIAVSPNNEFLIARDTLGVIVWRIETGERLAAFKDGDFVLGQSNSIWILEHNKITQYDLASEDKVNEIQHDYLLDGIYINEEKDRIISLADDGKHGQNSLVLFDAISATLLREIELPESSKIWNANETIVMTSSTSQSNMSFWDFELNNSFHKMPEDRLFIVSPSQQLLVLNNNKGITFWNLATGDFLYEMAIPFPNDHALSSHITFSPNGRLIAITGPDGLIELWGVPED